MFKLYKNICIQYTNYTLCVSVMVVVNQHIKVNGVTLDECILSYHFIMGGKKFRLQFVKQP